MDVTPLVSIVIPAYRSERTIGGAIASALTQTYENIKVVVCLDGVTDRSEAIVQGYGDLVTVIRQENRGVAAARNAAVAASSGELIALLDADDILLPAHVESAVARWAARCVDKAYVTCNAFWLGRAGIVPRRTVLPRTAPPAEGHRLALLQRNLVSGQSLYPRAMHEELGGFDTQMRVLEDYDFWVRAAFAGWTTLYETEPTALYRRAGESLSSELDHMAEYRHRMLRSVQATYADQLTDAERAYLDTALSMETEDVHLRRGDEALRRGDREAAAQAFAAASTLVPGDRRLRLKAMALRHLPSADRLYAWRERIRTGETERA